MELPAGISTLRRTDYWIGVPLCAVLTLVRKVFPGRVSPRAGGPRRLLFIKLAEQGSTVLAYPAICRAAEMVGRENVYFLVFEENRFILDAMEMIPKENVITIPINNLLTFALGTLRALRRARALDFDAVIDMEFLTRFSAILAFLTGALSRIGFHTFFSDGPYRGDLMTHRLLYNPHLHTADTFDSMVEAVRHDPATLPTFDFKPSAEHKLATFHPLPNELAEVDSLLEREKPGIGSSPVILLNPNAGDLLPLRRWPPERYVELAQQLLAAYPEVFVGFTGAPNEADAVNRLARQVDSGRAIALGGKTTLRQLFALYTRSKILVTNDSGPAHFASMTPIHVVTLFGPETPALFGARSPNSVTLWAGIACSPCVNAFNNRQSVCRNNVCMQSITVEQVLQQVRRIYEETDTTAAPAQTGKVASVA